MSMPDKIVKTSLSDQVCSKLRDMIAQGELPVGSRLPSESELAEAFGVSRLTVRMAIQKLGVQGLTVTRPGDGTFVKQFDFNEYMDEVSDVVMKPEMLDDVQEFRFYLEGNAIQMAIERAKDEDFDQLETIVETMRSRTINFDKPSAFSVDDCVELDYQFHATLCKLSGNSLFHLAFCAARAPITSYLKQITQKRLRQYHENHPHQTMVPVEKIHKSSSHEDVLQGLRNRDAAFCRHVLEDLVNYKLPSEEASGASHKDILP